jgi:hypothetical protein
MFSIYELPLVIKELSTVQNSLIYDLILLGLVSLLHDPQDESYDALGSKNLHTSHLKFGFQTVLNRTPEYA